MIQQPSLLLVEDDPALGLVISDFLQMAGFDVVLAAEGFQAKDLLQNRTFDLCILDVMLPGIDGFELARFIRTINAVVPIIFLTARSLPGDRIEGFRLGCDDYIVKPFNSEELILRIKALLKRCGIVSGNAKPEKLIHRIGKYEFNPHELTLDGPGGRISLTRRECELLSFFNEHRNQLVPRDVIQKAVWGNDDYFIGRSMDVFITRLRKYLKEDDGIAIVNSHGNGFKLTVSD
ncbi:MAG: response regulator transcription factor [Bacteroidales bacterium]|nr:response regulator transcription factor [Bacteroidales bacterium]MDD3663627.1 response regulator transcription factor [Bacteroidales bacterium]